MTAPDEWLSVESLDIEAQGIARNQEGKVVFIEGALPGEQARVEVHRRNISRKLDLRTVAELTRYAVREGLLPL